MSEGFLDTNVVIHARTTDEHSVECRAFLRMLAENRIQAYLDPLVLHELTYVLPRYVKQAGRAETADYLISILSWPGITADKPVLVAALRRWVATPGLGFVDAYLATRAVAESQPVYTKNVRELTTCGARVPNPLPSDGVTPPGALVKHGDALNAPPAAYPASLSAQHLCPG